MIASCEYCGAQIHHGKGYWWHTFTEEMRCKITDEHGKSPLARPGNHPILVRMAIKQLDTWILI